ncbi:peptidoglycan-binding domain-containing protein [Actinoplanes sp. CA-142083]|uniref:peptidoglycan-binding domain-containing protein n=1 Tax=Actinoplanes sp. CA-142083 TaxID=3239903 RepID=UPI003D8D0A17
MIRNSRLAVALSATLAVAGLAVAAPAQAAPIPAQLRWAGCPVGPKTYDIGFGDSGTAVSEVQCLLNKTVSWNAYPHSQPQTGYYSAATVAVVRVFQTCANNLGAGIAVDGRVGRQTLPHLRWWGQHTVETGQVIC